jgi:competence protein ComEA
MKILKYLAKYSLYINLMMLVIGVLGLILFYNTLGTTEPGVDLETSEVEVVNKDQEDEFFYISGAVGQPGVYRFDKGEVVFHAIEKAGGFSKDVDKPYVQLCMNLSKKLSDEQKIYIPAKKEFKDCFDSNNKVVDSSGEEKDDSYININTSSKSELTTLVGIGEVTAQSIIDNRPYDTLESLLEVDGIGVSTLEKIQNKIVL